MIDSNLIRSIVEIDQCHFWFCSMARKLYWTDLYVNATYLEHVIYPNYLLFFFVLYKCIDAKTKETNQTRLLETSAN